MASARGMSADLSQMHPQAASNLFPEGKSTNNRKKPTKGLAVADGNEPLTLCQGVRVDCKWPDAIVRIEAGSQRQPPFAITVFRIEVCY